MNRKFINAFFAAALLLGGATVFSSCKDTNEDMRTELNAELNRTKADLESRLAALEDKIPANLTENINNLLNLQGITKPVLDAIAQQIGALEDRADVAVTSVVLQSVENPVFGSISLPIDVKSNMLITYYGAFDQVDFPSTRSADNIGVVLTSDEVKPDLVQEFGGDNEVTAGGDLDGDGKDDAYLGTVYATINPTSVDAAAIGDNQKVWWSLVNSQDENVGGIELKGIAPSNKLIEFGLGSRANNGFYEATAVATNLDEIKYEIVDGLAEEVKDALTNHTKQDAKDLLQLVIAQLRKNDFPALGVKAAYKWNDVTFDYKLDPDGKTPQSWVLGGNGVQVEEKSAAAYSEYAIAAAAFKPLSFTFLKGESLDKLPVLPDLGDYKLTPEDLGININGAIVKVEIDASTAQITIPKQALIDAGLQGVTGDVTFTASNITELQEKINTALGSTGANLNKQIEDAFKKVNDKIAAATDKVQPWIDRANRVINKVNSLLENPNHYLQVCALYENGDKIGRLSNTSAAPSYFPGIEDGAALNLILTTYNLETVCPAYKKYYAVYKVGEATPVVADIINGTTSRVAVKGLSAGSYKVVYQALDYHGVTSTQKFYVEIGNN